MLKTFYFYFYYKIYRFQMVISPENVPLLTSLLTLSSVQFFLFLDILYFISMFFNFEINDIINKKNSLLAVLIGFILLGINYLLIMYKKKYKRYFWRFKKETETQRKWRNFLIIVLIIVIIGGIPLQDIIIFN